MDVVIALFYAVVDAVRTIFESYGLFAGALTAMLLALLLLPK